MRVLAVTKIFPNQLEPLSAPFNRQQFRELARLCDLTVLAAAPYVPFARVTGLPARAARLSELPRSERIDGIETFHMRQLYVPRVGLAAAVPLYLASLAPYRRLARGCDVILGSWAYPDGCAAVAFARMLGKPAVVKVHGTDVNDVLERRAVRPIARRFLAHADAVIAVSRALKDALVTLGIADEKIHIVRNGVDGAIFAPRDRGEARRALGLPERRPVILFVGRLEPQKGVGELLEAFARVRERRPDAMLSLVGDGVWRDRVGEASRGSPGSILAPGARPLAEVATWLAACDVFTLPSHREGTPNVVLEALASGRPVVGSTVGGIPDVLGDPRSGLLVPPHDAVALGDALAAALARTWDARDVAACGPGSWEESAAKLHAVLAGTRGYGASTPSSLASSRSAPST